MPLHRPRTAAVVPALALALAACGDAGPPAAPPARDLAARIDWSPAAPAPTVPLATLPAAVLSAPAGEALLGPGIDGRLLSWAVAPGDPVAAGQTLAIVESTELTDLSARVRELRAAVGRAREALALAEAAQSSGVGTAQQRVAARAQLDALGAQLTSAQARLRARQGSVEGRRGQWVWTAPQGGTVDALHCALGRVAADERCLRLVGAGDGVVEVRVPERLLPALDAAGTAATGHWTGADGREATLAHRASAPAIDPHTRQLRVHFTAPPATRVGASGRLVLTVPADEVVALPAAALSRVGGQDVVFVDRDPGSGPGIQAVPDDENAVCWMVPVTLLGQSGTTAHVRGLATPAPRVATGGTFLLKSLAAGGGA